MEKEKIRIHAHRVKFVFQPAQREQSIICDMSRTGTTYFVTGGASGLGRATCLRLHKEGANVAIADRDTDNGPALAEELGERALFVEMDATEEDSVKAAIAKAVETFGSLHGAINCAGSELC